MLRFLFLFIFCFSFHSISVSQQPVRENQKDESGRRQGLWRGYFATGKIRYEGNFIDDLPLGVFKYFYPQGQLRAELIHQPGEKAVKATYYHRNRAILGEGFFVDQQKEGLWRFFSDKGILTLENFYQDGVNHGVWKTYYNNGRQAELITWHRGAQQGLYERYFITGSVQIRANFENNLLHGKYEVFYPSGQPRVTGYYNNNVSDKVWTFLSQRGEIQKIIVYEEGTVIREDIYIKTDDEAIPLRPGPSIHDDPFSIGRFR